MNQKLKSVFFVMLLLVFAGTIWTALNIQQVSDWWVLRGYVPSAAVSELASKASLNEDSRKLFYVYNPQLLNKENFKGKCEIGEETIVLGCYISTDKIYVLDVDDSRLEGVEEVTAAHEMLHVVYDRLGASEKEELDNQLISYFNELNNERLNKTIESYRARDPNIVANELHSILGTEYADLPEELENHYKKYFIDRAVVVNQSKKYAQEFERRENQIKEFDARLQSLNASIEQAQTDLEFKSSALQQERSDLESLRGNTDDYNRAVPGYNANVNQFNRELELLKTMINEYNQIVKERNVVAVEEQELVEAIDSRLSEIE